MVPMCMGEKKMEVEQPLIRQLIAQPADAGAGVNDDNVSTFGPDFQAGGVTAIL